MDEMKIREFSGANMDIDLVSDNVDWEQSACPWNEAEAARCRNQSAVAGLAIFEKT